VPNILIFCVETTLHIQTDKETKHVQWHFPTASEAKDPSKAIQRVAMEKEREARKREASSTTNTTTTTTSSFAASASSSSAKRAKPNPPKTKTATSAQASAKTKEDDLLDLADTTSIAIIVPYRDLHTAQKRAAHLKQFVPYMHTFCNKIKRNTGLISDYHIYIIEQSNDGRKFNRGKLLNIGFDMACKSGRKHDVFIFHDVDLLPSNELGVWYAKMPTKPIHIARVWDRYSNNPKYFGGVVSFSKSDFRRINGYPNTFWGWGGEDDELQKRLERNGIQFVAPNVGSLMDLEEMNLTEKLSFLRENKSWKCMVKWEALDEHETTWKTNGLMDLKYKLLSNKFMDNTKKASLITTDVLLNGNHWANQKCSLDYMGG
jgi:hypothetical protein